MIIYRFKDPDDKDKPDEWDYIVATDMVDAVQTLARYDVYPDLIEVVAADVWRGESI